MSSEKHRFEKRVQRALGADRVIEVDGPPSQGPLDLLQLREDLNRRLCSTGGRPTDPEWSVRRLVPFKKEGWRELERLAETCRHHGQKVSPSQLAALLIEHGLEALKKSKRA